MALVQRRAALSWSACALRLRAFHMFIAKIPGITARGGGAETAVVGR
jgi:hypothetical protein